MSEITKDPILELLRKKNRAFHLTELIDKLGLPRKSKGPVLDILEELATLGLVTELPGRRFRAKRQGAAPRRPLRNAPTVNGRLTMHPSGFGFVARETGGEDVFIPPPSVGAALHGDRVEIRARPSSKGFEGEVIAVLDRGFKRLSGVYRRSGGNAWLDPDDARMRGPMAVRGKPTDTIDPGVHVVGEIAAYPRHAEELPEVSIVEVLGRNGLTKVEVSKLKLRDGIVEDFDADVLSEAAELPDRVSPRDRKGREDLRDIDLCTIDPVDARDHDDAVWAEQMPDGGYRVIVAIADVSYYVRPGTHIDRSALERGCSIYLPDRAIPMLPPELSSNLASLVAKKDRLCMAVEVELGPNGGVKSYRFIEGVMRSHAALTYEGAARALGLSQEAPRQREADARKEGLQVLLDLSRILRARRSRRGSLDFDLPEGRIRFDDEGEPADVYRMKGDTGVRQAYRLVEEMMLLANEVVARDLAERGIPTIYRVHGTPDEKKLARFCQLADALGHPIELEQALEPRLLAKFLRRLEGKPAAGPLQMLLLRAMKQAVYDTTNIGHFGLGSKHYLHFTSPIRRYPDLEVHRVLRDAIRGRRTDTAEQLKTLKLSAVESSRLERRAMTLERDVMNLYRALLMRDRIGEEFEGTISGIASHGVYTTLDAPFVDVHIPAEALGRDLEVDDLGIRLSTRYGGANWSLGDRLRVRIEEVNLDRREVIALPLDEATTEGPLGHVESTVTPKAPRRRPDTKDRPRSGGPPKGSAKGRRKRKTRSTADPQKNRGDRRETKDPRKPKRRGRGRG